MEQRYYEIPANFSPVLNLALALLKGRGHEDICEIVSSAQLSVVNTDYDNWNGGTYGYTVYVSLSVKQYTRFSSDRIIEIEKAMSDALNESIKGDNNYMKIKMEYERVMRHFENRIQGILKDPITPPSQEEQDYIMTH